MSNTNFAILVAMVFVTILIVGLSIALVYYRSRGRR